MKTLAALSLIGTLVAATAQADGTMRVGSDLTYPPYAYLDTDKKPAGFDPEIMARLAKAGGFDLEWIDTRFENLVIGVNGNKFDVIASALYINPERGKKIDFVPYFVTGVSIVVPAKGDWRPQLPEDLCGKRLGFIKGAGYKPELDKVSETICAAKGTKIDIREFPTSPEATQALLSGNIDAQTDDTAVMKVAADKTGGRIVLSNEKPIYPVVVGLGVAKNKPEVKARIEAALEKITANGEYEALLKSYSLVAPTAAEVDAALGK